MVSLNPIPHFPAYTGPYKVGTIDIEVPVSELYSPAPAPDPSIATLSVRIFYPCESKARASKPTYWFPDPQHEYLSAYFRFMGASYRLANIGAYFPRLLYHIRVPALHDAPLLCPSTSTKRWPVMMFSHGLGGSRNMYSHLVGSLASHGVVVIAPEHRDGSGPVSFIRNSDGAIAKQVEYRNIAHQDTKESQDARNAQLRIRLWEMGLAHDLALKLDVGAALSDYAVPQKQRSPVHTAMFASKLDVHRPGAIHWIGHSFGAVTVLQFLKSVFYRPKSAPRSYKPIYVPHEGSKIIDQITPYSNITLLDLWCMPTLDPATEWLHDKPLPAYSDGGPGGSTILAILSQGFYKWRANLMELKRAISTDPSKDPSRFRSARAPPHIFYPATSTHLSQSDFGVLFPWIVKKAFKAEEPERTLRLNVRAILEVWRQNGAELADTSEADMEVVSEGENATLRRMSGAVNASNGDGMQATQQDPSILLTNGSIRGWIALDLADEKPGEALNRETKVGEQPEDAVVEGEMKGE